MTAWVDGALFVGGWALCGWWLVQFARLVRYARSHPPLTRHVAPPPSPADPRVCVLVPARNEGAAIEACLRSLLAQDYPQLDIIAIDDRSTDGTGAIMDRVAAGESRLHVVHVDALPTGWLGKNHANWRGTTHPAAAGADYFLFTDGDVLFGPDCVRRAAALARERGVQLLAMFPELIPGGVLENAMCVFFGLCYMLKCKPWGIADPRRRDAFAGVGAFNLVERSAYLVAGGHERLRMEVVDDYKLGKTLKHAGQRCMLIASGGAIRVRWHVGLRGIVRGLEKNTFAGCDYSLGQFALTLGAFTAAFVLPWVCGVLVPGAARWGWVAAAACPVGVLGWLARRGRRSSLLGLLSPVCTGAMLWAFVRATYLTLRRGGVEWRGTFYSLKELKRGLV